MKDIKLTPEGECIARFTARLVIDELERRGVVRPDTAGLPARMTTAEVASAIGGLNPQTIRNNWKVWGLRKIGRGKHGMIFCGASVARYMDKMNHS